MQIVRCSKICMPSKIARKHIYSVSNWQLGSFHDIGISIFQFQTNQDDSFKFELSKTSRNNDSPPSVLLHKCETYTINFFDAKNLYC